MNRALLGDTIALEEERAEGEPLMWKVMENGRRLAPGPDLAGIGRYAGEQFRMLPEHLRRLETNPPYDVRISPALERLREATRKLYD